MRRTDVSRMVRISLDKGKEFIFVDMRRDNTHGTGPEETEHLCFRNETICVVFCNDKEFVELARLI